MGEGPFRSASLLKGANMVTAATRHLALGAKAEWAPHVCSHAEGAKLSTAKEKKARGGGGGGGGGRLHSCWAATRAAWPEAAESTWAILRLCGRAFSRGQRRIAGR